MLGQFSLVGIPPAPRGVPQVHTVVALNQPSVIDVAAELDEIFIVALNGD